MAPPLAALLFGLRVAAAPAAALEADSAVVELGDDSFAEALSSHDFLFVEFYAPWCGQCKKFAPVWEETARLAGEEFGATLRIAKVDATSQERLAKQHGIQSFPTLKLYRGHPQAAVKYEGPRTAERVLSWARAQAVRKLVEQKLDVGGAAASAQWTQRASPVALLGLRIPGSDSDERNAAMSRVLEQASFTLGEALPVGEAVAEDTAGGGTMSIFRNFEFETGVETYTPPEDGWDLDHLLKWIETKRWPTLLPAQEDTQNVFLSDIQTGHGLVVLFGGDGHARRSVHEAAVSMSAAEPRLRWVAAEDDEFGRGLGGSVGITPDQFPELLIWEFGEEQDDDKVFRFSSQDLGSGDITSLAVEHFIRDWQKGALGADKKFVVSATSSDFERLVLDDRCDVLVEFYAPWCGHCQKLAPVYQKLGEHYKDDGGVRIVKVDATKHKHPSAEVKSYPTIKMYAMGKKSAPSDAVFKADRDLQSLISFVEENRVSGVDGDCDKNAVGSEEGQAADEAAATPDEETSDLSPEEIEELRAEISALVKEYFPTLETSLSGLLEEWAGHEAELHRQVKAEVAAFKANSTMSEEEISEEGDADAVEYPLLLSMLDLVLSSRYGALAATYLLGILVSLAVWTACCRSSSNGSGGEANQTNGKSATQRKAAPGKAAAAASTSRTKAD